MAESDTAWVLYVADYDTGRQHSRIIPESVRVLRTSTREISSEELRAERERTGLGNRVHTAQIEVPPEVSDGNLAAYAQRYLSLEPGFDFLNEVIGDDIVVAGIAYDGDLFAPDGEGGVRPLTEAEQAARQATIRQRDAERETEQATREAQRRRQAIDYATNAAATGAAGTAVPPGHPQAALLRQLEDNPAVLAGIANNAIDQYLDHRRRGLDVADARQQAAIDAASTYATAWRTIEGGALTETATPPNATASAGPAPPAELDGAEDEVIVVDPRDVLPAVPALRGFRLAEEAIDRFADNREAGLDVLAARQRATTVHAAADQPAPDAGLDQNTAEPARSPADTAGRHTARQVGDLQERSTKLRGAALPAAEHGGASPTAHRPEQAPRADVEHRAGSTWEAETHAADGPASAADDVRNGWPSPTEHGLDIGP